MKTKIWYLYHSGFAVQTARHFLIFDYWKQSPKGKGLESGVIDPAALKEHDVIAFASHKHGDHFNRGILGWGQVIPRYRLVLSDDIPKAPGALMVGQGSRLSQSDFELETLISNDEGVAFVLDIDGLRIYHAGDLNWWHWEGEPDDDNKGMEESYKSQVALLQNRQIDIAFVPVDPRLEDQYAWGINHLMQTVDVRKVFPMHFGKDGQVVDRLLNDEASKGYREKIVKLVRRGDSVEI